MTLKTDLNKSDNSSALSHWMRNSFLDLVGYKIEVDSAKGTTYIAGCQLGSWVVYVVIEEITVSLMKF